MNDAIMNTIVPENIEGKPTDLEFSVSFSVREEALDGFKRAYKRLTNPPLWHELCGTLSASFTLTDEEGNEVQRLAAVHDCIRIRIPGPGTNAGDGYDWVKIEVVEDHSHPEGVEETFGMRVRPCANPMKDSDGAAHFFQSAATSTFIIHRDENTVIASYHGRNEVPNNKVADTIDNIRNTIVATGAAIGLSELQWSTLIKSFLQEEL